jgi:hypothetical protein
MEKGNFEMTAAEAVQPVAAADMRKPLFKAGSIRSRRSRERRRDGLRIPKPGRTAGPADRSRMPV